jgi:hypothetical protein
MADFANVPVTPYGAGLDKDWYLQQFFNKLSRGLFQAGQAVNSITELRAVNLTKTVFVLGYLTPLDGGGGLYYWDATSSASDNGGTVIVPNSSPATGRWRLYEMHPFVSQFGALLDGAADTATAVRACIAAAQAATMAGNSGIYGAGAYVGSGPTVRFPYGLAKTTAYYTEDTPSGLGYLDFVAENTIIKASAGVTVFGGVGYSSRFTGFQFRDGAVAISINTNNVDSSRVDIVECEFHTQTTACIKTSTSGGGTIVTIDRCKFMQLDQTLTGHSLYVDQCDFVTLRDCWISHYANSGAAIYNNAGVMYIERGRGVPGGSADRWLDNYFNLDVDGFNFGGEGAGGITLARNYAPMDTSGPFNPSRLSIRNCTASCTAQPIVEFYELPNIFEFRNNYPLQDTTGFYFDAELDYVDFFNWQKYGIIDVDSNYLSGTEENPANLAPISTNGDIGLKVMQAAIARKGRQGEFIQRRSRFKVSEIAGSGGVSGVGGAPWTSAAVNATGASSTGPYGLAGYSYTATSDDASGNLTLGTYLTRTQLTYGGSYTLNLFVEVTATSSAYFYITIGGARKSVQLGTGRHVVGLPFVYLNNSGGNSATYDTLDIFIQLRRSGDVAIVRRGILVSGFCQYTSEVLELEGTSTPSAYTSAIGDDAGYVRGDISHKTDVSAYAIGTYVCTTGGSPGTWSPVSAIAIVK